MNARTKVSAKGQVVIPKDVRDRLAWTTGTPLEVIETPGGLTLRQADRGAKRSFEDIEASIRALITWEGGIVSVETEDGAVEAMFRDRTDFDAGG